MRSRQRGVTAIGWLFLLLPLAVVGYAGIRLTPVYLNYMKVARTLEQTAADFQDDSSASPVLLRNSIEKRFNVEGVDYPQVKDIIVKREGRAWILHAAYEDVAPLFANISLLVTFDRKVEIR
jgi:hypothetical protein